MTRATRTMLRLASGLVGLIAVTLAPATPAHADTLVGEAENAGYVFHFGRSENGYVSYRVGVEFYADGEGQYVRVRGYADVTKQNSRVVGVRVDRVRLGILTAPGGVLTDARVPATDGGTARAAKKTLWVPVTQDIASCGGDELAARAWFTVRWADGRYGSFTALSKASTAVCRR